MQKKILYGMVLCISLVQPLMQAMEAKEHKERVKPLFEYCLYVVFNLLLHETPENIKHETDRLNDNIKELLGVLSSEPLTKYSLHTRLHKAATGLVVSQLLALGADPHAKTRLQETPLHSLLKENKIAAACALLEHGNNLDVTCKDADDITPVDLALQSDSSRLIELIEQHKSVKGLSITYAKITSKCSEVISDWWQGSEPQEIERIVQHCLTLPTAYDCGYYMEHLPKSVKEKCRAYLNKRLTGNKLTRFHLAQTSDEVYKLRALSQVLSLDYNVPTAQRETPLHYMIKCGNSQAALALLSFLEKEDCDTRDDKGFTPLCSAVRLTHTPLVLALLGKKVDATSVYITPRGVVSPLHMVVPHTEKYKIMDSLYREAGRGLCAAQRIDLMRLALEHDNPYLLRKVLPKNHTIDSFYAEGFNLVLYALYGKHKLCIQKLLSGQAQICGRSKDLTCVLKKRINPLFVRWDCVTPQGVTPLMIAARTGYYDVVKQIIDKGVAIDTVNQQGETALFYAVENGFRDIVTLLLDRGAAINHTTGEGETPLHYAVKKTDVKMVALLMHKGADPSIEDVFGRLPLYYATHDRWSPSMVRHLRDTEKNNRKNVHDI